MVRMSNGLPLPVDVALSAPAAKSLLRPLQFCPRRRAFTLRSGGFESRTGGKEAIARQRQNHTTNMYHKPADQLDPSWDLTGIAQDAQLYFRVGQRLASETTFPKWRESSEFKGARDRSMGGK